jgi:hypothetical protein
MEVFCFYLMEIVVESSSITEIPSVLPERIQKDGIKIKIHQDMRMFKWK